MNGRMGWGVNGEGEWGGGVVRMGGKGNREDSLERVGKGLKVAVVGFIVLTSVFTNTRKRGQFFNPVYLATTKRVCPAKNVWVRQIAEEQAYDLPVLSGLKRSEPDKRVISGENVWARETGLEKTPSFW